MLCKGIIGTIYKIGIWNVIQMKYFIDVKFPGYGNYGYMKEYPYFQKIHSEVKEHDICNLFSNSSEKIKIEYVSVTVVCGVHKHTPTQRKERCNCGKMVKNQCIELKVIWLFCQYPCNLL